MSKQSSTGLSYCTAPVRGGDETHYLHPERGHHDHHVLTPPLPSRRRTPPVAPAGWRSYVLCLGDLMIVLDQSIVNVALPSIRDDLGFSQSSLAWVVNAYLLTFGGFLLLSGRLGDLLGNKRVFLGGTAFFTVASVACGLAPSAGAARRRPRRPGPRRRRGLRGRAVADHGPVHRARRARQGDGRLRVRDVRRRRGRRAARRRADRALLVALDLPGQRPDRHRGAARRPRGAARRRRRARQRQARRARRRAGDRRADARGLRRSSAATRPAGPRPARSACSV